MFLCICIVLFILKIHSTQVSAQEEGNTELNLNFSFLAVGRLFVSYLIPKPISRAAV